VSALLSSLVHRYSTGRSKSLPLAYSNRRRTLPDYSASWRSAAQRVAEAYLPTEAVAAAIPTAIAEDPPTHTEGVTQQKASLTAVGASGRSSFGAKREQVQAGDTKAHDLSCPGVPVEVDRCEPLDRWQHTLHLQSGS
jgi:hypothetical protein